jgi:Myb-like DNA-binding domain
LSNEELTELITKEQGSRSRTSKTSELYHELVTKLPDRNLTSIKRYIQTQYVQNILPVGWTEEDDKQLADLFDELGGQWEKIAARMGRSSTLCRLRHREHVSLGSARKKGIWSTQESRQLFEIVLEILEDTSWMGDMGLGIEMVGKYVNWAVVSGKMTTRSPLQCRNKWADIEKWKDNIKDAV